MRKARAGEGPGPDPGKTLVLAQLLPSIWLFDSGLGPAQGGAGIAPGQDLVPGQSLAPGVAPGIVPGPDPGTQSEVFELVLAHESLFIQSVFLQSVPSDYKVNPTKQHLLSEWHTI